MKTMVYVYLNNEEAKQSLKDSLTRNNVYWETRMGAVRFITTGIMGCQGNIAFTLEENVNVYVMTRDLDHYETRNDFIIS